MADRFINISREQSEKSSSSSSEFWKLFFLLFRDVRGVCVLK